MWKFSRIERQFQIGNHLELNLIYYKSFLRKLCSWELLCLQSNCSFSPVRPPFWWAKLQSMRRKLKDQSSTQNMKQSKQTECGTKLWTLTIFSKRNTFPRRALPPKNHTTTPHCHQPGNTCSNRWDHLGRLSSKLPEESSSGKWDEGEM